MRIWFHTIESLILHPKILCTGHYSAVDGGAPKDFDLGRYVVSFHFDFTILGSHMLVAWFWDSSKTPCEIAIPNNWAPENSLKNHHSCKT